MSAVPQDAYRTSKVSDYYKTLIERTDDALLTDDEVFMVKGGNINFLFKTLLGAGAVFGYLVLTKRIHEVRGFEIRGSTFLWSNFVFFFTTNLYQYIYSVGVTHYYPLLHLHNAAMFQRFMLNYSYMLENKKKPKIH